jgi:peroxiredoxin
MKITYYICFFLFTLVVSCGNKDSYTLKGNIKGLQNSELYIVSAANLHVDTIKTKSGKFTYRGESETIEPLSIFIENENVWISLWVQNGEKFTLTGNINYPELILVKGGEINNLLSGFKQENQSVIKEKQELGNRFSTRSELSAESNLNLNDTHLFSQLKNVEHILRTQAQNFVEANPSSIIALVMIEYYILDIHNASDIKPFLDILSEEVKINPLYDRLLTICNKDLQIQAGQPALDFSITDTKNDTISLGRFKDKYLILTFASSLCEFCKAEQTELLAIHDSIPEKDLAILTISLDENSEDWKQSAEENGVNWTQVIDNAGWASDMIALYNVTEIPCNFLIDKNGMIIGSKLSANNIQEILNEKLKN